MKPFSFSSPSLQKLITNQAILSTWVTVILLLSAAWVAGKLIWFPYQQVDIVSWQPSASTIAAGTQQDRLDLSTLQNSHLFGRYQADVVAPVAKPKLEDAPKSRLNVVLVGVVTSSESNKSLAVVAKSGKQATYGVNEVIAGTQAKLIQVQSDRIIVDNSGRNETVMLEGIKYSKPTQQQAKSAPATSLNTKEKLEQIRTDITTDPKQIFQYVRMSQMKQDGEVVGYRLSAGKSRELFDAVGLKNGDVATHLNGQDLRNAAAMGEIFNRLSELTELNLTVERNGQPYDIYIEL
ncbi:general secretion pathway protein C [Vibrio ichthyoenteri ATCC 700023]|uniref:General secretion pathway protein C n=1 Tax=Vibrio ichthyoenteri ATCC 700023 TaxID=870968 RepID=F9S5E2_9VIBR|nr:type II secretion system protein GspC [Vibrio ichthyoenteri]EGU35884.1 general secretion pathway protein C [Vibrio ichthyoenteri ATCC 700023]